MGGAEQGWIIQKIASRILYNTYYVLYNTYYVYYSPCIIK